MKVLHDHLDPLAYKLSYIGNIDFVIDGVLFSKLRHGFDHARVLGQKSVGHRQARKGAIAIIKINKLFENFRRSLGKWLRKNGLLMIQ